MLSSSRCVNYFVEKNANEIMPVEFQTSSVSPLVVLYNGLNRNWDFSCENHMEVIKKITNNNVNDTIMGIHYWKKENETNIYVPPPLKDIKQLASVSNDEFGFNFANDSEKGIGIIKKFVHSIKIALQNAETLFFEVYGENMPMNQTIIRFRYDAHIDDIDNLPLPIIGEDNYFLSIWNTKHRDFNRNRFEIADTFIITKKKAIMNLINIDIDKFVEEKRKVNSLDFHETILYLFLKEAGIKVIFDYNLKLSIVRGYGSLDQLTA